MKFEEPKVVVLKPEERAEAYGPELVDQGIRRCCYR